MADWMANSSPPWAAYCSLMAYCLVALDKCPEVRPIGIGETLCRAISKLLMRAAGDQAKTACRIIQLCTGIEAGIKGETHTVAQRWHERHMPEPGVEQMRVQKGWMTRVWWQQAGRRGQGRQQELKG